MLKEVEDKLAVTEAKIELLSAQARAEIDGLNAEHANALDALRRDYNKKSNTARVLLSEREDSLRILSQRITELEQEILSGAPSERKIFELASSQAKREATHGLHKYRTLIAICV